ncbi:MAG TPA: ABC transporter permease [Lentibacillus sp.]|uniref:ABC transporter permease n=1 Tax=Lentibacillus sp. TaxID=1925746 RepID=UPI002B4AC4D5|nr:ABC transporter permease [Lentibacillus sp.]HLR62780.1 ABC transporter permease [Lentibacillus sp.]
MKSAITVLKEQIQYFHLIRRLSLFELKSNNSNNYLGMLWELISPAIQVTIYWFVFSTLRSRDPVDVGGETVPFFPWLIAAFFLWIFFHQSIVQGSRSIFSRLRILSKMNFPMSVIPNFVIFSRFYVHLMLLGITIVIFQLLGYYVNIYYLQLFYFIFASFCLFYSISLITSTLSTMIRDVHMFLTSTLRMMLYLSGVLWPLTLLSDFDMLMKLMQLNPVYYLLQGYRHALFGVDWYFITQWEYTLFFWAVVVVLFLIGAKMHVKFRRHFIDYL